MSNDDGSFKVKCYTFAINERGELDGPALPLRAHGPTGRGPAYRAGAEERAAAGARIAERAKKIMRDRGVSYLEAEREAREASPADAAAYDHGERPRTAPSTWGL
jgi:hypothetical protein